MLPSRRIKILSRAPNDTHCLCLSSIFHAQLDALVSVCLNLPPWKKILRHQRVQTEPWRWAESLVDQSVAWLSCMQPSGTESQRWRCLHLCVGALVHVCVCVLCHVASYSKLSSVWEQLIDHGRLADTSPTHTALLSARRPWLIGEC